jgi:hypothetical protein
METAFPFGFPFPTAFYLTLYVSTLVIHVIFMNYVLAGTAYLAVTAPFSSPFVSEKGPRCMGAVLRDWMPFALSAAITAGVAPLLFIQILYKHNFYTANLLLFHRWMAILPVLIVGFYLLYVLRSRTVGGRSATARVVTACGALACFAFTGYSWTENHLLSLDREAWASFYASGALFYRHPLLWLRLGVWFAGSIPTMVTILSWQLWSVQRRGEVIPPTEHRRAGRLAIIGLLLSVVLGYLYYRSSPELIRAQITGSLAGPYLVAGVAGLLLQTIAWSIQLRKPQLEARWLCLASAGVLLTIVGMTVVREAIRMGAIDIETLYVQHAGAAAVGGRFAFVAFLILNVLAIAWCVLTITRRRRLRGDTSTVETRPR